MLYQWQNPESLIHRAEIFKPTKYSEAVLYAPAGVDAAKLQDLNHKLKAEGFNTVADIDEGQPVLHVMQIESPEKLLTSLERYGATSGNAITSETRRDILYRKTTKDKFKENTASIAGYLYVLADAMMMVSGYLRRKGLKDNTGGTSEILTGLAWGIPNLNLAVFGKKDARYQMADLMDDFHKHLKQEGVEIPEGEALTIQNLTKSNGMLDSACRFLSNNAITINNTGEAIGGLTMTRAGLNQKPGLTEQPNYFKAAAGGFVTTGMGLSVILPEKKKMRHMEGFGGNGPAASAAVNPMSPPFVNGPVIPKEGAGKDGSIGDKTTGYFQSYIDEPMKLAGTLPIFNNALNLYGSLKWEPGKLKQFKDPSFEKGYDQEKARLNAKRAELPNVAAHKLEGEQLKKVTELGTKLEELEKKKIEAENYGKGAHINTLGSAVFILANLVYRTASKNTGADIEKCGGLNNILAVAANVIAAQRQEVQPVLIQRLAADLAQHKEIPFPAEELAATIHEKVQSLPRNPWAERVKTQPLPQPGLDAGGPAIA